MKIAATYKTTVLIVDDIPASLDLLMHALTQINFRVLVAESGQRALQILEEAARQQLLPDIILMDVSMNGLDGFETCRQIKGNPTIASIPVIFVTAHDQSLDKVRGFDVGGADYILKPIDLAEMQARINTHLALSRLRQELQSKNLSLQEDLQSNLVQLQVEVAHRKEAAQQMTLLMQERNKLLDLVSTQSDHLRDIANNVLATQSEMRESILHILQDQIEQKLASTLFYLNAAQTALVLTETHEPSTDHADAKRHLQKSKNNLQDSINYVTQLSQSLSKESQPNQADNPLLVLSARERETMELIAQGKSNSEIATILYVAEATVRTHRARIMRKLGAKTSYDLARIILTHKNKLQ